jgi:pyroglutamyl-peptidase
MNYTRAFSRALLLFCAIGLCSSPSLAQQERQSPAQGQLAQEQSPVILLTGFEPFGVGKPPNPSWEAIQALDGTTWKGYRLVCKRMPVVWGKPLTLLQAWIDQYQPVLILSLGQGGARSFSLESKASILRGRGSDNLQQLAPAANIVENGPGEFLASIDSDGLRQRLSEKGYLIRVSTNAGRYLCEETLYCLEYLKRKKGLGTKVLFCHVPPLGSRLGGQTIDVQYLQRFAIDTLDACCDMYQMRIAPSSVAVIARKQVRYPQEQEIEKFIQGYFQSWSAQQFFRYDACFMRNACIQFLDDRGRLATSPRKIFIAQQRQLAESAPVKRSETAETIKITFEADVVRVVVFWKLTEGAKLTYGYDHFTLIKHDGAWKIVNLLFYGAPAPD